MVQVELQQLERGPNRLATRVVDVSVAVPPEVPLHLELVGGTVQPSRLPQQHEPVLAAVDRTALAGQRQRGTLLHLLGVQHQLKMLDQERGRTRVGRRIVRCGERRRLPHLPAQIAPAAVESGDIPAPVGVLHERRPQLGRPTLRATQRRVVQHQSPSRPGLALRPRHSLPTGAQPTGVDHGFSPVRRGQRRCGGSGSSCRPPRTPAARTPRTRPHGRPGRAG